MLLLLGLVCVWCACAWGSSVVKSRSNGSESAWWSDWHDCAVVGTSGTLIDSALGARIDAHGTVIRVNWAPVLRYADSVGMRVDAVVSETSLSPKAHELAAARPLVLLHAVHDDAQWAHEFERYTAAQDVPSDAVMQLSDELEVLAGELVTREDRRLGFGQKVCSRLPADPDLCLPTAAFAAALLALLTCRDSVTLYGFAGPRSRAPQYYFEPTDTHLEVLTLKQKPAAARLGVTSDWIADHQARRIEFQILALVASGRAPESLWEWRRAFLRDANAEPPTLKFGNLAPPAPVSAGVPSLPHDLPDHRIPYLRPLARSFPDVESAGSPPGLPSSAKWRKLVRGFRELEDKFLEEFDVPRGDLKRLERYMAAISESESPMMLSESTNTTRNHDAPPTLNNCTGLRIPVVPADYENAAERLPRSMVDPALFELTLSDNTYPPVKELGHGTYGTAFLCFAATNNTYASADVRRIALVERQPLVIKVLKSASLVKLARELQVLAVLRGLPHTLQLLDTVRMGDGHFGFVVPFTNLSNYRDVFPLMSAPAVRDYVRKVLVALDGAHSRGIVHLDLKPLNIFFDHRTGELQVGDWGLSRFYHRNVSLSWRTMTAYYKAPEVFMGSPFYSYAVDMWSLGAVFAGMIVGRFHFFEGKNMDDVADQWIEHLGTDEWDAFVRKYRFDVDPRWARRHTPQRRLPTPWLWYIREQNRHMISAEALDLLSRMLRFDPVERITAREALMHPYFDPAVAASTVARPPYANPYDAWEQRFARTANKPEPDALKKQ
jgi:casein kinase II subunit alpha